MKKSNLIFLFAILTPILPYVMPNHFIGLLGYFALYAWVVICILFIIFLLVKLVSQSINFLISKREINHLPSLKNTFLNIGKFSFALLLSLLVYNNFYKLVRNWEANKVEKFVEKNLGALDQSNQLNVNSESIQKFNSRVFAKHYSMITPDDKNTIGRAVYYKDILFEDWDCHLYYCKNKPEGFPPFEFYKAGKNGYDWYEFCHY